MTINGSTNSSGWTYKLEVTETGTSVQNKTSTIQVKTYLGRANSRSYLGGGYSNSVTCAGQTSTQTGTISYPTYINGGAWLELKTFTFTVSNTESPTTISISSTLSSSDFSPSSSSASGTMNLTILHQPPVVAGFSLQEQNADMTAIGIHNTLVVYNLSKKKFTISATASDSATITTYNVYNNNVLIGTSATNEVVCDFRNITITPDTFTVEAIDSTGASASKTISYYYIEYTKPNLVKNSTTIKRKSGEYSSILGRTANLTDGIASINVSGLIYKENNEVGNNNSITQIGYKVWQDGTSEPANYTSFSTTPTPSSTGEVTVSDYEISGITFTSAYNYKIILADSYKGSDNNYYNYVIEGTIPLGQPAWTEYKDHVDFLSATIKGNTILMPHELYYNANGSNATIQLSDDASNYDYLEIYYFENHSSQGYSSKKIESPDGKIITLDQVAPDQSGSRVYISGAYYTISSDYITYNSSFSWAIQTSPYSVGSTNQMYIVKVIGYK